ncbi:MAG: hypothetical protein HPY61_09565 [Methanotrichaceae archaeon]|nr:hypothetical protein [Methanotrichaceae archaeon]
MERKVDLIPTLPPKFRMKDRSRHVPSSVPHFPEVWPGDYLYRSEGQRPNIR